jgi:hypothetical protein
VKWDYVIAEAVDLAAADAALVGIFGTAMYYAGSRTYAVPSLEHQLITETEGELWNPMIVQWDIWTRTMAETLTAERRLRVLFHQELPITIGGMPMWCQYEDGEGLSTPDRDNVYGRAVRFRFTPLRSLYDPVPSDS